MGGADFRNTFGEIALGKPIIGARVRSYADCVAYVGDCSLATAAFDSLKVGCKYLIHADGKDDKPHCLIMVIHKDGSARIPNASTTYVRRISDIKDTLADAVGNPIISKYDTARKVSYGDSHRSDKESTSPILKMKAGAKSPEIAD